jgi:hypothetical protein
LLIDPATNVPRAQERLEKLRRLLLTQSIELERNAAGLVSADIAELEKVLGRNKPAALGR